MGIFSSKECLDPYIEYKNACRNGNLEGVKQYRLKSPCGYNWGLMEASYDGHTEIIKYLLNFIDKNNEDDLIYLKGAMVTASGRDQLEVIKLLLNFMGDDAEKLEPYTIALAIQIEDFNMLKLLLPKLLGQFKMATHKQLYDNLEYLIESNI